MRSRRSSILALPCVSLLMLVASLGRAATEEAGVVWPTQHWQSATPEQEGLDSAALARLVEFGGSRSLDSVLIVRHGKIVLDVSYAPYDPDMLHVINSATKAVVGTLAAIADQDGKLGGAERPVLDFFNDRSIANPDDRKKAITLQALFDMTSGLAWQEPLTNAPPQSMFDMEKSPDWVQFILDRPMVASPGETFNYNSGNPHLVSAILAKVTGMKTEDYAKEKLFAPLGITSWKWRSDPQGISTGGYGLALHPRDMAKLGYLYLHNGEWDGKQVVPRNWIDSVNHAKVDMKTTFYPALRYANFFWALPENQIYWANGYHCQTILVYPTLDIVAVTTGKNDCSLSRLTSLIRDSVKSQSAMPTDPMAADILASAIRKVATETPTAVGQTSPIAADVSGKTYQFSRNPSAVKSLAVTLTGADPHYDLTYYNRNPNGPLLQISGPIGLDGLYRRGEPTVTGISSVKGRWLSARTFEIERLTIGGSDQPQRWTLLFDGDKLKLRGRDFARKEFSIESE